MLTNILGDDDMVEFNPPLWPPPPPPSDTLEIPFMVSLELALGARRDITIWRQNAGGVVKRTKSGKPIGRFDAGPHKGIADICGIADGGVFLAIETKSARGVQSDAQAVFQQVVQSHGGIYVRPIYDETLSMADNVAAAVKKIEQAIADWRNSCSKR